VYIDIVFYPHASMRMSVAEERDSKATSMGQFPTFLMVNKCMYWCHVNTSKLFWPYAYNTYESARVYLMKLFPRFSLSWRQMQKKLQMRWIIHFCDASSSSSEETRLRDWGFILEI